MVEHDALVGMGIDKSKRCGQLIRKNQQVIGQAGAGNLADAAMEIRVGEEPGIRSALDHLAHAFEEPVGAPMVEPVAGIRAGEIDPPDHPEDGRGGGGDIKQEGILGLVGACLYGNGAVHAGIGEHGEKIIAGKIPA